jgi:phospholipase/carboxylesterase
VFIGAGRADPISPAPEVERLAEILQRAGAEVTLHWHSGGHELTPGEVSAARAWLARVASREEQ